MRRLVLLRHGEAQPRASGGGDLDRPLTPRGAATAAGVARRLAERGVAPTLALVSTATRTVETWEAAAPAFAHAEVRFIRGLYNADAAVLWDAFEAEEAESVLIVAHNPGIHHLAASLARRAGGDEALRIIRDYPPAACAAFALDGQKVIIEASVFPEDLP